MFNNKKAKEKKKKVCPEIILPAFPRRKVSTVSLAISITNYSKDIVLRVCSTTGWLQHETCLFQMQLR